MELYLTPRDAAEYLRSSPSTLAKMRCRGGGPEFCRIGRAIRYRSADLDEWMASGVVRSTSQYLLPIEPGRDGSAQIRQRRLR